LGKRAVALRADHGHDAEPFEAMRVIASREQAGVRATGSAFSPRPCGGEGVGFPPLPHRGEGSGRTRRATTSLPSHRQKYRSFLGPAGNRETKLQTSPHGATMPGPIRGAAEKARWSPRTTPRDLPMPPLYVLAIDQGTTSTRAVVYDAAGRIAG